jgi:hypothetical protein
MGTDVSYGKVRGISDDAARAHGKVEVNSRLVQAINDGQWCSGGVAIAAFLTFAGRTGSTVKPPTVAVAYVAIFIFLLSVGFAVRAMFRVINYVEAKGVGEFLKNLPWLLSPFLYSAIGFLVFLVAVALHVWSLFISAV